MKRAVLGGIVIVLALVAVGLGVAGPASSDTIEPNERDSELYASLADAGVSDAVVEISDEHVLVRYEVPDGMNRTESLEIVLRKSAAAAPNTQVLVVQVYDGYEPALQATVETSVVLAYVLDELTYEDVEAAMEIDMAN